MKQASLSSCRIRAWYVVFALICVVAAPSVVASQEKETNPANAAAAPAASSRDVITVPDGKPVGTKLTKDLSTATAKVGDEVEVTVAHAVLQDGLVIIPRGAVFSAKITSVRHACRALKEGRVSFSVENAVLPGGEIAALRSEPPRWRQDYGFLSRGPWAPSRIGNRLAGDLARYAVLEGQ